MDIKKYGKVICGECGAKMGHLEIPHGVARGLCKPCKEAQKAGRSQTP